MAKITLPVLGSRELVKLCLIFMNMDLDGKDIKIVPNFSLSIILHSSFILLL